VVYRRGTRRHPPRPGPRVRKARRVRRRRLIRGKDGKVRRSLGFAPVRSHVRKPLQPARLSERVRTGANGRWHLPCRRSWVRVPSSACFSVKHPCKSDILMKPEQRHRACFSQVPPRAWSPQPSACISKPNWSWRKDDELSASALEIASAGVASPLVVYVSHPHRQLFLLEARPAPQGRLPRPWRGRSIPHSVHRHGRKPYPESWLYAETRAVRPCSAHEARRQLGRPGTRQRQPGFGVVPAPGRRAPRRRTACRGSRRRRPRGRARDHPPLRAR